MKRIATIEHSRLVLRSYQKLVVKTVIALPCLILYSQVPYFQALLLQIFHILSSCKLAEFLLPQR